MLSKCLRSSRSVLRPQRRLVSYNFNKFLGEKDGLLFTPGPLTTSKTVKEAMLHDWGSRDTKCIGLIDSIRSELLRLADVSPDKFTTVLLQGSGTFCVEATITSTVAPNGKILVLSNGAYGARAEKIAKIAGIDSCVLECPEDEIPDTQALEKILQEDKAITDVICIHSETTSGIVNPVEDIGQIVHK
eukprot:UN30036